MGSLKQDITIKSMLSYVFPGQGSQEKGMGGTLFDDFGELTDVASNILGYSIKQLCLEDPEDNLHKTKYTQPAIYTVNALSNYKKIQTSNVIPDFVAGHSLGEYNALLASGVFDFETGLKIVQQRGALMGNVSGGAMAAVVGLNVDDINNILFDNNLTDIDTANFNTPLQTVISGSKEDILRAESYFLAANGIFIPLKTSGAFHSRYMKPVRDVYREFLTHFDFKDISIPIISNVYARPYDCNDIVDTLADQITNPVKWTESIQYLLGIENMEFEEIGHGVVLGRLIEKIKKECKPLKSHGEDYILNKKMEIPNSNHNDVAKAKNNSNRFKRDVSHDKNVVFMYGGQGSHYFQMGKELYENNYIFRKTMERCRDIAEMHINRSLIEEMYLGKERSEKFDDIIITHAAIFSVEYSLTQILLDYDIKPDATAGYSLGEYVAATVGGMLSLEDALLITIQQAKLLHENNDKGAMLVVLDDIENFMTDHELYRDCDLAGVNYENNFVVSGSDSKLREVYRRLQQKGVICDLLAVNHAFHSSNISPIKNKFVDVVKTINLMPPKLNVYSSIEGEHVFNPDINSFWQAVSGKVNFKRAIQYIQEQSDSIYVDLSPTGTLSNFVKYGFQNTISSYCAINRFCQNDSSINSLVNRLKDNQVTCNVSI